MQGATFNGLPLSFRQTGADHGRGAPVGALNALGLELPDKIYSAHY